MAVLKQNENQLALFNGWYGTCDECDPFLLTDASNRGLIYKVWQITNDNKSYTRFDATVNPEFDNINGFQDFTELECGKAYIITLKSGTGELPINGFTESKISDPGVGKIIEMEGCTFNEELPTPTPASAGTAASTNSPICLTGSPTYTNGTWLLQGNKHGHPFWRSQNFTLHPTFKVWYLYAKTTATIPQWRISDSLEAGGTFTDSSATTSSPELSGWGNGVVINAGDCGSGDTTSTPTPTPTPNPPPAVATTGTVNESYYVGQTTATSGDDINVTYTNASAIVMTITGDTDSWQFTSDAPGLGGWYNQVSWSPTLVSPTGTNTFTFRLKGNLAQGNHNVTLTTKVIGLDGSQVEETDTLTGEVLEPTPTPTPTSGCCSEQELKKTTTGTMDLTGTTTDSMGVRVDLLEDGGTLCYNPTSNAGETKSWNIQLSGPSTSGMTDQQKVGIFNATGAFIGGKTDVVYVSVGEVCFIGNLDDESGLNQLTETS